ncbi:hypothetical protein OUZ56_020525 [Daphnia magna]|uniref:Uncharacterized protein n=1 Tax=Daphnia magna TaxID=35525 RepID=A0ABQ9ZFG1_9CRUS|nr:hypothetical protein OUZ56_020525 [Daphnia magna]
MQMLYVFDLFWLGLCISSTYGSVLKSPTETTRLLGIQQDELVEDVQFSIVSINKELTALGEHPETLCPFRVENRTIEQDHPLGNLVVEISEIVCLGSCSVQRCGGAGSTLNSNFRSPIMATYTYKCDLMFCELVKINSKSFEFDCNIGYKQEKYLGTRCNLICFKRKSQSWPEHGDLKIVYQS